MMQNVGVQMRVGKLRGKHSVCETFWHRLFEVPAERDGDAPMDVPPPPAHMPPVVWLKCA